MSSFRSFLIGTVWHNSLAVEFIVVGPRKGWRRMPDADALKECGHERHGLGERRRMEVLEGKNRILWDIADNSESE